MKYNSDKRHRHTIRLQGHDYTQPGAYYVTICTGGRENLFGTVQNGEILLSEIGETVERCWLAIPEHFSHVVLDAFVIMPNHLHGIICIVDTPVGTRHAVSLPVQTESFGKPVPGSLATIIRSFKSAATKQVNLLRGSPGAPLWQGRYFEHIVRNDWALERLRRYIEDNPFRWAQDRENPACKIPR